MNRADFEAAQAALVQARRSARAIAECPADWHPGDLAEAYLLQAAVIAELGGGAGWKVAAITPEQRRTLGVAQPIASAIPLAMMQDASLRPASLRFADFIAPKIECEIAFQLRRDLPPRANAPYSRNEVAAAIESMRLAIEIVDPRWPAGSGTLAELADGFNNGALVSGPRFADWEGIDFAAVDIVLTAAAPSPAGPRAGAGQRPRDPRGRPLRHGRDARQCPAGGTARACGPATSSPPAAAPARRSCRGPASIAPNSATSARVELRFE